MGVFRRLVQEDVLDDDAFHRHQAGGDVVRVRVGLSDVLALDVHALEGAIDGLVEHVGDAQARILVEGNAPERFEGLAGGVVRHVAVARQFVRERAHVARTLDVVLSAQRVHAGAQHADIAGGHGDVGHAHDHGRALAVLGDAETVIDARGPAGGVEAGGAPDVLGVHADLVSLGLRRVALLGDETSPGFEIVEVAALPHIGLVDQPFRNDDMRHRVDEGDVGAGLQRQVVIGLDMGRLHQVDPARIGDDELGALTQALLHPRAENGVTVGRVRTDDEDHVGMRHRGKILRAGRGAERRHQAVAGGRMADAGAGIDVVVAEGGANELLDEVGFLVGAARRGDAAHGILAVLGLDSLELGSGAIDRDLPRHFLPGVRDLVADHRLGDAVLVGGVSRRRSGP